MHDATEEFFSVMYSCCCLTGLGLMHLAWSWSYNFGVVLGLDLIVLVLVLTLWSCFHDPSLENRYVLRKDTDNHLLVFSLRRL